MAILKKLIIENDSGSKTILDENSNSGRFDWSIFKNTPSSLVSGEGHVHDMYYPKEYVSRMFSTSRQKLEVLYKRIEKNGEKTDLLMAGGEALNNGTLNKYNLSTEVFSTLTTSTFNISKGSSLSFQRFGYFLNDAKKISKYNHFTNTPTALANTDKIIINTLIDFAVQSTGFVFDGSNVDKLNILLDTFSAKPGVTTKGNYRNGLSSFTYGYLKGSSASEADGLKKYTYSSGTLSDISTFNLNGDVSALQKNSTVGFWIGSLSYKHNYSNDAITTINLNKVNSNCIGNDINGYVNSGETGGANGLVNYKINWATESISTALSNTSNTTHASYLEI